MVGFAFDSSQAASSVTNIAVVTVAPEINVRKCPEEERLLSF